MAGLGPRAPKLMNPKIFHFCRIFLYFSYQKKETVLEIKKIVFYLFSIFLLILLNLWIPFGKKNNYLQF